MIAYFVNLFLVKNNQLYVKYALKKKKESIKISKWWERKDEEI